MELKKYFSLEIAEQIHRLTVIHSGGGAYGKIDLGKLDSVLQNIQNDDYYPTCADKITHLFFCACKFHAFEDGNKRIAITLPVALLQINGYGELANRFFKQTENITYHVAAGKINKDLLHEIVEAILDNNYEGNLALMEKILIAIA
ncbi:MAG: Fic family protein [Clostridia bacterium]|nr:Fic family protein [Clostridia bacterium]